MTVRLGFIVAYISQESLEKYKLLVGDVRPHATLLVLKDDLEIIDDFSEIKDYVSMLMPFTVNVTEIDKLQKRDATYVSVLGLDHCVMQEYKQKIIQHAKIKSRLQRDAYGERQRFHVTVQNPDVNYEQLQTFIGESLYFDEFEFSWRDIPTV